MNPRKRMHVPAPVKKLIWCPFVRTNAVFWGQKICQRHSGTHKKISAPHFSFLFAIFFSFFLSFSVWNLTEREREREKRIKWPLSLRRKRHLVFLDKKKKCTHFWDVLSRLAQDTISFVTVDANRATVAAAVAFAAAVRFRRSTLTICCNLKMTSRLFHAWESDERRKIFVVRFPSSLKFSLSFFKIWLGAI